MFSSIHNFTKKEIRSRVNIEGLLNIKKFQFTEAGPILKAEHSLY